MADDITDTGPLEWSKDHTRAQWVASAVLVAALIAIGGMFLFWRWWG